MKRQNFQLRQLRTKVALAAGVLLAGFALTVNGATGAEVNSANPSVESGCPSAACTKILAAVKSGITTTKIPSNLTPNLAYQFMKEYSHLPTGGKCETLKIAVNLNPGGYDGPCVWNSSGSQRDRIALLGDSHAFPQWTRSFLALATSTNSSFGLFARPGCRIGTDLWEKLSRPVGGPPSEQCSQFVPSALAWVAEYKPTIVVVAARAQDIPPYTVAGLKTFTDGLSNFLGALRSPGRKVFIMADNPTTWSGPSCLVAHTTKSNICNIEYKRAINAPSQLALHNAAARSGTSVINTIPWLCTTTTCPAIVSGYQVYSDSVHLSSWYCKYLADVLRVRLGL